MLRRYIFWLLDFLKGNKIRKHYNEIVLVLNHASTREALQQQENNLSALLRHAVTTTPFYKNGYPALKDFPVVNKSIIRESFNSFISNKFKESELIPVVTSGSTGTPFKVYHDRNKKLRNSADTIFFAHLSGYNVGDRMIYLKVWVNQNMKSFFRFWIENMKPVDVFRLNDVHLKDLLRSIENDQSPCVLIGYASALELVCKYLEKNCKDYVNTSVKSVIAMSETLNDFTKKNLQKYFHAPVVSRYSNLENGIIAQQEIAGLGRYVINTASYIVEILKMDSDEQAEPGQTGRIVVTDLFNYGMPLIRYDTGDIGVLSPDSKKAGNSYLAKVEGRKQDMLYDTQGNFISSYRIQFIFEEYPGIIQYQLIQTGWKEYVVKLNTDGIFKNEAKLIKELNSSLGEDAVFMVEYVSEIPLLSSGKRKMIINTLLQKTSEAVPGNNPQ
jgi:phenylacetate-CoA ligase